MTEKVIKEQEALLEKQKHEHEERKAKEMLLRDDIKMKQEEKELQLLVTHFTCISFHFLLSIS